jgi:hypothetical protein
MPLVAQLIRFGSFPVAWESSKAWSEKLRKTKKVGILYQ